MKRNHMTENPEEHEPVPEAIESGGLRTARVHREAMWQAFLKSMESDPVEQQRVQLAAWERADYWVKKMEKAEYKYGAKR